MQQSSVRHSFVRMAGPVRRGSQANVRPVARFSGEDLPRVRLAGIQWGVGGFLACSGALMLVSPHQFDAPAYAAFRLFIGLWGLAFLSSGVLLLASAVFSEVRPLIVCAHLAAGSMLLLWAGSLSLQQSWLGTISYGVLGLGTLIAPWMSRVVERSELPSLAWFPVVLGFGSLCSGMLLVALPSQLNGALFDALRPRMAAFGAAYIASGGAVIAGHVIAGMPRWSIIASHTALATTMFAIGAPYLSVPAWTGILYAWGLGGLLLVLAFIGPRLTRLNVASLNARLSICFALVAAFPLVGLATLYAVQQEGTPAAMAGQNAAFGLLLAAVAAAAVAGAFAARWVAKPILLLVDAAEALARDDSAAPLPESSIAEVRKLSERFAEMRERLALRTRDREEALRQKDEFLEAVTHDLKTPLTAIKGNAQLLQRGVACDQIDPVRLKRGLEAVESGASRLEAILSDLLEAQRLDAGQAMHLATKPVDLVALVSHLVATAGREGGSHHRISARSTEATLVAEVDGARLERVLQNLLDNAIKYSPEGGSIDVYIRTEVRRGIEWVLISVTDQGIGIPEAELNRILVRGHRGSNTGRIGGTGIGLSIAREIVDMHGGALEVESRVGKGSTFTVRLPLAGRPGLQAHDKTGRRSENG